MGVRQTWNGTIEYVGRLMKWHYQGSKCAGAATYVQVVVKVTDGRNKDREIRISFTPMEANDFANQLRRATSEVQKENEALGTNPVPAGTYTDTPTVPATLLQANDAANALRRLGVLRETDMVRQIRSEGN